jgi:hypothetical protein
MNKQHINFYCNLSLLFFCNIDGTQLQSLPSQLEKLSENDPYSFYILLNLYLFH